MLIKKSPLKMAKAKTLEQPFPPTSTEEFNWDALRILSLQSESASVGRDENDAGRVPSLGDSRKQYDEIFSRA